MVVDIRLAQALFRAHIIGSPQQSTGVRLDVTAGRKGIKLLGNAKVEEFYNLLCIFAHDEDVVGLKIAMHDASLMCTPKCPGNLPINSRRINGR